jgi:nucleotide-binding universal stress UspA family protein
MQTILAPIDFSDASDAVIAESIKLARAFAARLVVVHVHPFPLRGPGPDAGTERAALLFEAEERAVDQNLAALEQQMVTQYGVFETRRLTGPAAEQIVKLARDLPANYLVIGSHGHGAIYELLIGSTARELIKLSPCPVLVIPVSPVLPAIHPLPED